MKRWLPAVSVLMLLVLSVPSLAFAQVAGVLRVTADRTSIRDTAATDGAVVANVVRGDDLQLLSVSGAWYRVRTSSGREGFVHSLFVERVGGASAPSAAPAVAATTFDPAPRQTTSQAPAGTQSSSPLSRDGSEPIGNRRFGFGLANIGPSVRYWMDGKKGFQVDGYFSSNFGYSVTAISPSFIMRFNEPKTSGSITFLPYAGGGVTFWHWDDGYNDYYCGQFADCDASSLGFGGFVGSEVAFESLPKLAISGNAGYYSSALGYGGFGIGLGIHYYPGAR